MKSRFLYIVLIGLALGAAYSQDAPTPPPTAQNPSATEGPRSSQGQRGGWMGGTGMGGPGLAGRGIAGTVTALAPDRYTIKTEAGEIYAVHFSANTRILKQRVFRQASGDRGAGGPPILLKPTDIRIGDAVAAIGEVDAATKSVGAMTIVQIDPERARQMREMQANYGKTWLLGKITAIDGVKVTLMGSVDSVSRTFVADENTTFRKRREPITMADMQVGDPIRVEGTVKGADFVATLVAVMPKRNVMVPRQTD